MTALQKKLVLGAVVGAGVLLVYRFARAGSRPLLEGGGDAQLNNGRFARYIGPLDGGIYTGCRDAAGNVRPDSDCAGVVTEWPELEVSLAKRVLMAAGTFNL